MFKKIKDQLDNEKQYKISLKRIISIVPSQTEFLYDLGLEGASQNVAQPKNSLL
jgi:ABC-type Fe3+-hydroxamate transport system substrate-binding protein